MPELCRLPRLAAMLGLAELVVVVLALAPDGSRHWTVGELLSASGFALWLALAVTASLPAAAGAVQLPGDGGGRCHRTGGLIAVVRHRARAVRGAG